MFPQLCFSFDTNNVTFGGDRSRRHAETIQYVFDSIPIECTLLREQAYIEIFKPCLLNTEVIL